MGLMKTELADGTVIEKGDDGSFIVTAWGSVQIKDKQGDKLPIDEVIKDTPIMMAHHPKIHLHHTDTEVGDILDVQKAMKTLESGKKEPATMIKYSLYGTRRFHKAVRKRVEKGLLGKVSIKGFAYGKSTFERDGDDVARIPHDLEIVNYALCGEGAVNPESDNTSVMVGGKEIMKDNDLELLGNDNFLKEVRTHMNDGMPWTEAMTATKETYSDELHKELLNDWDDIEPQTLEKMIKEEGNQYIVYDKANKGDKMPTEIETIQKDMKELQGKYDALVKSAETLTTERDGFKADLEKAKKVEPVVVPEPVAEPVVKDGDEPVTITKESVLEIVKADREAHVEEIKKDLLSDPDALMKAMGLTKHKGGAVDMSSSFKEYSKGLMVEKDADGKVIEKNQEGLIEFNNLVMKAKEASDNTNIDDIPSEEEITKAVQKEAYNITDGE